MNNKLFNPILPILCTCTRVEHGGSACSQDLKVGGVGFNGVVGVNGGEWGLMGLICSDIFCNRVEHGGSACS